MIYAIGLAFIGSLIRLVAVAGKNGNYISIGVGQVLIGLANIRFLLELLTEASNLKKEWTKIMVASSIPGGYIFG